MKIANSVHCLPCTARHAVTRFLFLPAALCAALSFALPAAASSAVKSAAFDLHKRGQYQDAATQGLADLLSQPWDHQLRFIVADSLQRVGKVDEAIAQLETLEGTAFADAARVRLRGLKTPLPIVHAAPRAEATTATASPRPGVPASSYQPSRELASGSPAPVTAGARNGGPAIVQSSYVPTAALVAGGTNSAAPQIVTPAGQALGIDPRLAPAAPPGGAAALSASVQAVQRTGAAKNVADLYAAENYQAAGTMGSALLQWEQADDELVLAIANSLAWTGRLTAAISAYQRLTQGPLANEARVGIANVQRWRGRDDLAAPLYRDVLAADPANQGAREGLMLAQRELNPRTTLTLGGFDDSSDVRRDSVTVNHRFRDSGGINLVEIETSRIAEDLGSTKADQNDLTLRYHATTLSLKPTFELNVAKNGDQNVYGSVQLKVGERDDILQLGRVNWGKLAVNPNALRANLDATHLGMQMSAPLEFGMLSGRVDYYDISDDNTILSGNVRLLSNWRPLGSKVKPFIGAEFRDAKFSTSNYWSPESGYGSLFGGLLAEWSAIDWSFYTSGQLGTRLYGEAGASWSAATGGKRWLSDDVAVGFGLWSMASRRNDAAYRASSLQFNLEKLW